MSRLSLDSFGKVYKPHKIGHIGKPPFYEIEQVMLYLTDEALDGIRVYLLPEVQEAEVGRMTCWCRTGSIMLPEDLAEKLPTVVDPLVSLKEKVPIAKLAFTLNLFYCTYFRQEYDLTDNDIFMRVCAKHYQGGNNVFPNTRKPRLGASDSPVSGRRVRSLNARFRTIDVQIDAELARESRVVLKERLSALYGITAKGWQ